MTLSFNMCPLVCQPFSQVSLQHPESGCSVEKWEQDSAMARWPRRVRRPVDCKVLASCEALETAPNTAQAHPPHTSTPPWLLPSAWPRWEHLHDLRFTPSLFCLISCLGFRVSFLPRCIFPYNCQSKDPEIPCFSPSLSVQPQISALGAHLQWKILRPCLPAATWQELALQRAFKAQRSLVPLLPVHHTYPKWTTPPFS